VFEQNRRLKKKRKLFKRIVIFLVWKRVSNENLIDFTQAVPSLPSSRRRVRGNKSRIPWQPGLLLCLVFFSQPQVLSLSMDFVTIYHLYKSRHQLNSRESQRHLGICQHKITQSCTNTESLNSSWQQNHQWLQGNHREVLRSNL
jgi:hypothetical protein